MGLFRGLSGPVVGRQSKLTNLSWFVDATLIEQHCSIQTVSLVNNFYAAAVGLEIWLFVMFAEQEGWLPV